MGIPPAFSGGVVSSDFHNWYSACYPAGACSVKSVQALTAQSRFNVSGCDTLIV